MKNKYEQKNCTGKSFFVLEINLLKIFEDITDK